MARKVRIQYPEAIYQVMNRGDRREAIFEDDEDRERLLETLTQACQQTLEFGHFPQNSATESNPEGWQRVAGGRSGQMVNDHRKGVACPSTPERGARRCE